MFDEKGLENRPKQIYKFVSAFEAAKVIFPVGAEHTPEVVLDEIGNFDGQEFLEAIAVFEHFGKYQSS